VKQNPENKTIGTSVKGILERVFGMFLCRGSVSHGRGQSCSPKRLNSAPYAPHFDFARAGGVVLWPCPHLPVRPPFEIFEFAESCTNNFWCGFDFISYSVTIFCGVVIERVVLN
jgi:hypothetical protein